MCDLGGYIDVDDRGWCSQGLQVVTWASGLWGTFCGFMWELLEVWGLFRFCYVVGRLKYKKKMPLCGPILQAETFRIFS